MIPAKGSKLPYRRLVSVIPFEDGIGLQRDGVSAKPQHVQAYHTEVAATGYGTPSGQAHVIQVGTTYAVFDPAYRWGLDPGYHTVVVFDSRWRKLSRYTP